MDFIPERSLVSEATLKQIYPHHVFLAGSGDKLGDAKIWAIQNFGGDGVRVRLRTGSLVTDPKSSWCAIFNLFAFKNNKDALMFKMVWS